MDKKTIGHRLAALRGDVPRIVVAKELEISRSALSMYENGNRIPRDETKIKFANYYKSTVEDIFFTQ